MAVERSASVEDIARYSRATIAGGSKSFAAASRLLDSESREGAHMLYAWCRHCDDLIDAQHLGSAIDSRAAPSQATLEMLQHETRRALDGQPVEHPAFVALQCVARRYDIPERYPLELLQGFAMDVNRHEYGTLEDTLLYCYHVAGVVGVMMAHVMGVRGGDALLRAADLGIAFQLTNVARDVMDDARAGRMYLPATWLEEAGVPRSGFLQVEHRSAVFALVCRLLAHAERYYDSALEGLPRLDWRAAWGIATARYVYRDIGRLIVRRGPAALEQRVVVGRGRKLFGAARGLVRSLYASSLGRRSTPRPRAGLWTKSDQLDA
jgi:phytoene synthase